MTDYDRAGYAARFARARAFDTAQTTVWSDALAWASDGSPAAVVVDLGAGTGRFWPVIDRAWTPRRIIAVDNSRAMLEASSSGDQVVRVVADLDDLATLDLGDDPIDAVFCSMSLHYSRDPVRLCRAIRELVRPGGVLAVRTGTKETLDSYEFLRFFPTALRAERSAMPSGADVQAWLESAGFGDVRSRTIASPASTHTAVLRRVLKRGFPSLQLVPPFEFAWGVARLAVWSALRRLRSSAPRAEEVVMIRGRAA